MAYIPYTELKEKWNMFEVIFYEKENGDCPVQDFLSGLDIKMQSRK